MRQIFRHDVDRYTDRFRQKHTYSPYPAGTPSGAKNGETALPYGSYTSSQAHYYYS